MTTRLWMVGPVLLLGMGAHGCSEADSTGDSGTTTTSSTTTTTGPTPVCPLIFFTPVDLSVADEVTSTPICDATVAIMDGAEPLASGGSFTMQTVPPDDCTYAGRFSTTGTFSLVISADGYEDETVEEVEIRSDSGCDAQPVPPIVLDVTLTPTGGSGGSGGGQGGAGGAGGS